MRFLLVEDKKKSNYLDEGATQEVDSLGNPLTPEQVKFFTNSKVRDSQGRLLVCYHGTNVKVTEFEHTGKPVQLGADLGYWFTDNKNVAINFSNVPNVAEVENKLKAKHDLENTYANKLYDLLSGVTNLTQFTPEEVIVCCSFMDVDKFLKKYGAKKVDTTILKQAEQIVNDYCNIDESKLQYETTSIPTLVTAYLNITKLKVLKGEDVGINWTRYNEISSAIEERYDGVLIKNGDTGKGIADEYVVFNSNQIKSITNTNPTNSNNINEELLSESLHSLGSNCFITNSPYDIRNLLLNKPKLYRILYDANIDMYMIGDGREIIHQDLLEKAFELGYYTELETNKNFHKSIRMKAISKTPGLYSQEGIEGLYDDINDRLEFGPYLLYMVFSPNEDDFVLGEDSYDDVLRFSFGSLFFRDADQGLMNKCDLIRLLQKQNRASGRLYENRNELKENMNDFSVNELSKMTNPNKGDRATIVDNEDREWNFVANYWSKPGYYPGMIWEGQFGNPWISSFGTSLGTIKSEFPKGVKKVTINNMNEGIDGWDNRTGVIKRIANYLYDNPEANPPKGYIPRNSREYETAANIYGDYVTTPFGNITTDDLMQYARDNKLLDESLEQTYYPKLPVSLKEVNRDGDNITYLIVDGNNQSLAELTHYSNPRTNVGCIVHKVFNDNCGLWVGYETPYSPKNVLNTVHRFVSNDYFYESKSNELEQRAKKHKKKSKGLGWYPGANFNSNAGDVEKGIEIFNNSTSDFSGGDVGMSMGEAISNNTNTYFYDGPIYYRGHKIAEKSSIYTSAPTLNIAARNILFRAANGADDFYNYDITDDKIKMIKSSEQSKPISKREVCSHCGYELNDMGDCPVCDYGEYDLLDEGLSSLEALWTLHRNLDD